MYDEDHNNIDNYIQGNVLTQTNNEYSNFNHIIKLTLLYDAQT